MLNERQQADLHRKLFDNFELRNFVTYKMCFVRRTIALLCLLALTPVQSQIQTDGSLGSAQSLTGPDYRIDEALGRRAGSNLFHSFSEFNVNSGESATFTGACEIANVISRVTGGRVSTIDGLLKSEIPNANFYLINSAGILFGPNASLSINGSFHASTADYLRLGDADLFYSKPLQGEILSIAAPMAFGFFSTPDRGVTVTGSQLDLKEGTTLSLVGAEVTVKNARGNIRSNIQVPEGQINLISVASAGEAIFDLSGGNSDLNTSTFEQLGAVNITRSGLNVDGEGGGRVVIRGGQMVLIDSFISARTAGEPSGKGIDLVADELRFVRSQIDTTTTGDGGAGDVRIDAETLVLNGLGDLGAGVFASSTGADGNAGAITMTADQVDVMGNVGIEATAQLPATAGTIQLLTPTLKWNGFDAEFQVNSGKGELTRLESGNIILDGSFDPDLDGVVLEGPNYRITENLGQTSGNNLFHSFKVFFVDEAETVTFSGAETISNIIARVTGDNVTHIYGELISEIPGADLYLINPNGFFIGAGATLDLSGSFHVGTADYLTLGDIGRFSASVPEESVLDNGEVSAYGFMDSETGAIVMEYVGLRLPESTLSLIGGNIRLIRAALIAYSGQVNLVSLQSPGEASIREGNNGLDVSEFSALGDIDVSDNSLVTTDGLNGNPAGLIFTRSHHMSLSNNGDLESEGTGGRIDLMASGDLFIGKNSQVSINSDAGDLGQLSIAANNITIDGTGQESFTGLNVAQLGELAAEDEIKDNLQVTVDETLSILNGGVVNTATIGTADAGSASIRAKNLIIDKQRSNDFTGIFSASGSPEAPAKGAGGKLDIAVEGSLQIIGGGVIDTATFGTADAGSVTIRAKNLTLDGQGFERTGISSVAAENSTGNGGDLNIAVEELFKVVNGGTIDLSTAGVGDAGSAIIHAKNLVIDGKDFDFTGIGSIADGNSTGNGGNLNITVEEQLQINNGRIVASSTKGNAGNLRISAGSDIHIANSRLNIAAGQTAFNVNDLDDFLRPELSIEAGNSIRIQNSILGTNAGEPGAGFGVGGDINLLAPTEIRLENSSLFAQAGYAGGNIFIDPAFYIVISSDVIAQADIQGGNYNVIVTTPSGWIQSADSQINLSGEQSGSVISNASPFDLGTELSDLDESFLNVENWALQPCEFRPGGVGSSFFVESWRGVSNNPDDFLPSEPILLTDSDRSEAEPIDDTFLQEIILPELKDGCDDCP